MLLSVFIAKWRADTQDDPDYAKMEDRMQEIIRGMVGKGIVSVDQFRTTAGEAIAVVKYESSEARTRWRNHPEHVLAQRLGRERWFDSYRLVVAEVIDDRAWPSQKDGHA
jgi:heme-degrading monooxygenase HmoA